jgi:hypothetical protein
MMQLIALVPTLTAAVMPVAIGLSAAAIFAGDGGGQ